MINKLNPINGYIVIEPTKKAERTDGGILIPDNAKERPQTGTVVEVYKPYHKQADDKLATLPMVHIGQTVLYTRYAGLEVKTKGGKLLVMKESDILAIVE